MLLLNLTCYRHKETITRICHKNSFDRGCEFTISKYHYGPVRDIYLVYLSVIFMSIDFYLQLLRRLLLQYFGQVE